MYGDRNIALEIRYLSNTIKRDLASMVLNGIDGNLSEMQGLIIGYVGMYSKDKQISNKDIEKEFNLRKSTVSELLTNMEQNGLIRRETVENDARVRRIELTEKAKTVNRIIEKNIKEYELSLAKEFDEDEMKMFFAFIDRLKKSTMEID